MARLSATLRGVDTAAARAVEVLDRVCRAALEQVAEAVADAARTDHTFTNRTGKLERSIATRDARGSFTHETLNANVVASAPYAVYVEDNNPGPGPGPGGQITEQGAYAFLMPAYVSVEQEAYRTFEDALAHAAIWTG